MKETQKSMVLYYVQDEKKRIQMEVLCMSMSIGTKQLKPSDLNTQVGTLIGAKNIEPLDPAKEAKAPAIFCMPEIIIFSGIPDKKLDEFLFSYKKVGMTPTKLKAVITPQNASWSLYHLIRELSNGESTDRSESKETFRGKAGTGVILNRVPTEADEKERKKMQIDLFKHEDNWQDIKDSAMNTINKTTGKYPDSEWKRRLILSEHSPIRRMHFYWRWKGLKSWVSVHMVRHKIGIEHWVSTQRSDRTGVSRDELPQGALVNHACEADAQALINISRKRLCSCASPETREAWQLVKEEVARTEPELAGCMVKECIYRGFCPEMFSCGYHKTEAFQKELDAYRKGINE